jgi:hypothetical protein
MVSGHGRWGVTGIASTHSQGYILGHSDYVDDVSEAEARPIAPADFVS